MVLGNSWVNNCLQMQRTGLSGPRDSCQSWVPMSQPNKTYKKQFLSIFNSTLWHSRFCGLLESTLEF